MTAAVETQGQNELRFWKTAAPGSEYVYVLQTVPEAPAKIGWARNAGNVGKRVQAAQTYQWDPVKLLHCFPGNRNIEGRLHTHFASDNVRREWFEPSKLPILEALAWLMIEHYKLTGKIADPLNFFHKPKCHRGMWKVENVKWKYQVTQPMEFPNFTIAADRFAHLSAPPAPQPGPFDYIDKSHARDREES